MDGKHSHCPYCGHRHRRADRAGQPCADCERIQRLASATIRAWTKQFDDDLAWLFIQNPMRWIRPTRLLNCSAEDAKWGVRLLRRRGFIIKGDPRRGYMLTGWTRWGRA